MGKSSVKCAIYTRKSSEEGLDQSFNSLEAQREACEAYIVSQKHEGWITLAKHYDDGGFSGGSMERPALTVLLADIKAEKINTIVVYKVDRLTRSLADFAKIVEILDERGVTFVSVTQHFNTTSSMGRLTLNVLLSFAQFEREITGERIRDKIAASKRKGMWMGGVVPLGYLGADRRLVVNEPEAEQVRLIFRKYLQFRCVSKLKKFLDQNNIRSKMRKNSGGQWRAGSSYSRGALYHLLNNRVYLGEICHREEAFVGQHQAIVSKKLWKSVANQLKKNNRANRAEKSQSTRSLLCGKLFDNNGVRFTPTHAVKNGKRYRYYTSQALVKGSGPVPPIARFPAESLERAVVAQIYGLLGAPGKILRTAGKHFDADRIRAAAKASASNWAELTAAQQRLFVAAVVHRVILSDQKLCVEVSTPDLVSTLMGQRMGVDSAAIGENAIIALSAELEVCKRGCEVRILTPDSDAERAPVQSIVRAIAQSRDWYEKIVSGQIGNIDHLVQARGLSQAYIRRILPCANLAPAIVERLMRGHHNLDLSLRTILRRIPLPWADQESAITSSYTKAE